MSTLGVLVRGISNVYDKVIHTVKAILLPRLIIYDTIPRRMRDKDSVAITITLPGALDRALETLAQRNHCGNKSAAIRAVLYKEAGISGKLLIEETASGDSIAKAEQRAVKYGTRKKKKR